MNHTPDQKSVHKPVQDFALPQRSTKIVATLGPASSDLATLERMFQAGVEVGRLNFSHGTAEDNALRVERDAYAQSTKDLGLIVKHNVERAEKAEAERDELLHLLSEGEAGDKIRIAS